MQKAGRCRPKKKKKLSLSGFSFSFLYLPNYCSNQVKMVTVSFPLTRKPVLGALLLFEIRTLNVTGSVPREQRCSLLW